MSISNVSVSNLQQANVAAIKTDQKTVHKQDINELKKEIKSIGNKVNDLNKKCAPNVLKGLTIFNTSSHMKSAKNNLQKSGQAIVTLKNKIADLKGKITNSSYKHNSSKMQTLNTLDNQLKDINKSLNVSSSNIKSKQGLDTYHQKITNPKHLETEAAQEAEKKAQNKAFMKENPSFFIGGMVK